MTLFNSGMDLLQEIQVSGTRKNPFAEVALERLLDANLSAKYSLTGQLSTYTSFHQLMILMTIKNVNDVKKLEMYMTFLWWK